MKINVEENLIEPNQRSSVTIENEMQSFLESNEGENIKSDIQLLTKMGFNKIYLLDNYLFFIYILNIFN